MKKSLTRRGKSWELLHSWWVFLTYFSFGFLSFIGFLYAGVKMKDRTLIIWGLIYLLALTIAIIVPFPNLAAAIILVVWVTSSLQAYKVRPSYLVQLDLLKSN